jgi:hypothetical protein
MVMEYEGSLGGYGDVAMLRMWKCAVDAVMRRSRQEAYVAPAELAGRPYVEPSRSRVDQPTNGKGKEGEGKRRTKGDDECRNTTALGKAGACAPVYGLTKWIPT